MHLFLFFKNIALKGPLSRLPSVVVLTLAPALHPLLPSPHSPAQRRRPRVGSQGQCSSTCLPPCRSPVPASTTLPTWARCAPPGASRSQVDLEDSRCRLGGAKVASGRRSPHTALGLCNAPAALFQPRPPRLGGLQQVLGQDRQLQLGGLLGPWRGVGPIKWSGTECGLARETRRKAYQLRRRVVLGWMRRSECFQSPLR